MPARSSGIPKSGGSLVLAVSWHPPSRSSRAESRRSRSRGKCASFPASRVRTSIVSTVRAIACGRLNQADGRSTRVSVEGRGRIQRAMGNLPRRECLVSTRSRVMRRGGWIRFCPTSERRRAASADDKPAEVVPSLRSSASASSANRHRGRPRAALRQGRRQTSHQLSSMNAAVMRSSWSTPTSSHPDHTSETSERMPWQLGIPISLVRICSTHVGNLRHLQRGTNAVGRD
jgi:hypothetical protein